MLSHRDAPVLFVERALAVRTEDGQTVILLQHDLPDMTQGYLLSDTVPCGWLRLTDNGLTRLHSAVVRALEMEGLATN